MDCKAALAGTTMFSDLQRTPGNAFPTQGLTPEVVAKGWDKVIDFTGATNPSTTQDSLAEIVGHLQKNQAKL